jgi:hypothetical protein
MVGDQNIANINALAQQEVLDLPKIFGPNSVNGPSGPPTDLIMALELLETTTGVDPITLTGSQAVVSAETKTLTDLQSLATATKGEIFIASIGAISENFIQELAFNYEPAFAKADPAVVRDATQFVQGDKPPYTIVQPQAPPANGAEQYLVTNMTTGVSDWEDGQFYSGPVAGVTNEFVTLTPDNLNITATQQSNFIHTGAGNDAINVSQSTFSPGAQGAVNVLDGGAGSNFLVGASITANDFILDDRNMIADIFSTVVNLKQGDTVTAFGVNQPDFQMVTADNVGATGYTGLDIGLLAAGRPNANVVLTGYSSADLRAGRLSVSFGVTPSLPGLSGSQYMMVHASEGTFPANFI